MLVLVLPPVSSRIIGLWWLRRVYGGSWKTWPFRMFPSRLSCGFAWQTWHFLTFQPVWWCSQNVKIGGSLVGMLVFLHPRVLSRVSRFPVASPCLWGKLENLSFSNVSKQVVILFCVAGVALCDIPTCLIMCENVKIWGCLVRNARFSVPCNSSRVSGFPVASSCLWGKLRTPHSTLYTLHFTLLTPHLRLYTPHSTLYTPHSTLYTRHFTLYTPHSTHYTLRSTLTFYTPHTALYTPHSRLSTRHSTLYTPHFTLYTPHSTLYTPHPHFTLHTLHFPLHTSHSTLHTLLYTPHSTLYTLHSSLHTPHLHSSLYTPHSTHHTLHFPLQTPHSTLYAPHSTLYTPHFTLSHFTLLTPHSALYTPHSTLYTPHSLLYTPHSYFTLHTSHSTLSTLLTLHSSLHTLHSTLYTPHSTLYTLHSTLYTPHSPLYTLHYTLYTPHFTLYTPRFPLYTPHSTLYTPHFYTPHSTLYTLYTPHSTLYTPHSLLHTPHYTFQSTLQTGNKGNMHKTVQIIYCRKVLCMTAKPCVLTSVPKTYVWAFGFVGFILFSVFLSTLFKKILTWSSSLLPVPSKPPTQWWHLPGGQQRSSSKRCWKWRRRKAWRRPTSPPIHGAWRCHEMSGLVLVSRWMFHDVSWCFSFMMFPRWLWQYLFRRRKTSWKFKEDSKKRFSK